MTQWYVLVEERVAGYTDRFDALTVMLPADDEESGRALAERVAFEHKPVWPGTVAGRSVFQTGDATWTVSLRSAGVGRELNYSFHVYLSRWLGDRPG